MFTHLRRQCEKPDCRVSINTVLTLFACNTFKVPMEDEGQSYIIMWFWIIVIAVVIGAIIGFAQDGKGEDATTGALAGGCMAAGCLVRLAIAALGILVVLRLFGVLFG